MRIKYIFYNIADLE